MIKLYAVYFIEDRGSRGEFKGAYETLQEAQKEAKGFGFYGVDGMIIKFISDGIV